MHNTAEAIINLSSLHNNLITVRKLCPQARIMAMIKADGYGHGLLPVAEALSEADGFSVARLQEAIELRRAGFQKRILLAGTLLDSEDLHLCSSQNIDVVVHDEATAARAVEVSHGRPLVAWLKLDSGMHRLGLSPSEFKHANDCLSNCAGIKEIIHMTHLSSADLPDSKVTNDQLSLFFDCHEKANTGSTISIANSAAIISRPELRVGWVRPGIMLYGDNPFQQASSVSLQPVMELRAKVVAVREISAGECVGYAASWKSCRQSRIATIGIGYGDGYPRHAEDGTPLIINGNHAPLVGRVSMDSITADVTECGPVQPGDDAILWGSQLPAYRIAKHSKTITHELFTSLGRRVKRTYINPNKDQKGAARVFGKHTI